MEGNEEMQELKNKIYEDIQTQIRNFYNSNNIKYKDKDDPQETIIDFFSNLYKLIPLTKRSVHYSDEISKKIGRKEIPEEHINVLKKYEEAFVNGEDMNVFLSNNIKNPRETDFLRNTWHLYHLHMSGKFVENTDQMKNNRSDTQLLCIINKTDVFYVDIIPHPTRAEEYFNLKSLEIIINNGWIEKIGFCEMTDLIPGTLKPIIKDAKDIFSMYSQYGVNIAFEFHGKGYSSLEPIGCDRKPFDAALEMININKNITKLYSVNGTYKGFQMGCNDKGELLGLVEFETPEGEIKQFNIF